MNTHIIYGSVILVLLFGKFGRNKKKRYINYINGRLNLSYTVRDYYDNYKNVRESIINRCKECMLKEEDYNTIDKCVQSLDFGNGLPFYDMVLREKNDMFL